MDRYFRQLKWLLFTLLLFSQCAYFNYYYNAQKYYRQAERAERSQQDRGRTAGGQVSSLYEKSIESAGKVLLYYPDSRWEDDALLLIAKAYYNIGKYRSALTKVEELEGKYLTSPLLPEGRLYKGLCYLKMALPDSALLVLESLTTPSTPKKLSYRAYIALGDYELTEKRFPEALINYRQAEALASDEQERVEALLRQGDCLVFMKDFQGAVSLYRKLSGLKLTPSSQFQVSLALGKGLRLTGSVEEAYRHLENIAPLAISTQQQGQVELEMIRCLIAQGWREEAMRRLKLLTDREKRGPVAAEAFFLLGELLWNEFRDGIAAREALQMMKNADRNHELVPEADSLVSQIEALGRRWSRLSFLHRMTFAIDSALKGLRSISPRETLWVDSLKVAQSTPGAEGKPPRTTRTATFKTRPRGDKSEDTSVDHEGISEGYLDTVTLMRLDSLYKEESLKVKLELGEIHLWEMNDKDSARFYLQDVLDKVKEGIIWAKALGLMAYLSHTDGDTAARDSIYRMILARPPDERWEKEMRRRLHQEEAPTLADLDRLLAEAESLWWGGDWAGARQLYLLVAAQADSQDLRGARALYAASYLSRRFLGDEELSRQIEKDLKSRYPRSPQVTAGLQSPGQKTSGTPVTQVPPSSPRQEPVPQPETLLPHEEKPIVYSPDKVDEVPRLLTTQELLKSYIVTYYPFEALGDRVVGRVELELTIDPMGRVREIGEVNADPQGVGFEESARKVAELLEFTPARKGGSFVWVKIRQRLEFNPYDQP